MLVNTPFNPFTSEGLIELPDLDLDTATPWIGFQLESLSQNEIFKLADPETPKLAQLRPHLLKLDITDFPLLDVEDKTDSSAVASDEDDGAHGGQKHVETEHDDDIWTAPDLQASRIENKLVSWDHFVNTSYQEPPHTFLSESNPAVYDLLLRKVRSKTHGDQTRYVRSDVVVSSLFDLGLGRNSVMFSWDNQGQRFKTLVENYTISGCSRDTLQNVVDQHLDAGAQFHRLRNFAQSRPDQSSIKIALQSAVECVLDTIQDVVENMRHEVRTLVRLRDAFAKPFALLDLFDRVVKDVRSASDDDQLVSSVIAFAEHFVPQESQFEHIIHAIVSRMIQPILRDMEVEVGLASRSKSSGRGESRIASEILPATSVQLFNQTKNTLRILYEHNYSLQQLEGRNDTDKAFNIAFFTNAIITSQTEAKAYEQALSKPGSIVRGFRKELSEGKPNSDEPHEPRSSHDPFHFDANVFGKYLGNDNLSTVLNVTADSSLEETVLASLSSEIDVSIDIIPSCRLAIDLSIAPFLRAQHRLLSYRVLQLLFGDHNLVSQMQLLGRFPLMNDGFFASKLSIALFDSDQFSGEGSRRMHSKTGLRLQNRTSWPPASSELRLALMGILSESTSNVKESTLTDAISFTIRELSDEDLDRCKDLDSIYALDFLGINFKPSNMTVEAVITTKSLEQYDQIFNHLLRTLRMKAVAQTMLRNVRTRTIQFATKDRGHRFRIEAQRFVSAFADYCTNIVIKSAWFALDTKMNAIKERLENDDYNGTLDLASGLDHLRDIHESTLDTIMHGLMLKRRQSDAKGIIDRLFEVILRFAAVDMKPGSTTVQEKDDATMSRLHRDFEIHIKTLIHWLKDESGRVGNDRVDVFDQLFFRLDWNGFWSR